MDLDLSPELEALRDELRAYFGGLLTDALREELRHSEGGGPEYRRILRRMGADGWLGLGWPREYGGGGRSPLEQFVFADEVQRAGFPLPFLTLGTVGPTIMRYGSDEQRRRFLPPILRGELHFAIGYTEPGAGTDLASLSTRATRDGDDWVIRGQKVFTSLADFADYVWVAARTDPEAPKHEGISLFAVPTDAPGYRCAPMPTMAGVRTYATYFDDVRVPHANLVGGEGRGWALIVSQLNLERVSLITPGPLEVVFEEVREWARRTKRPDGRRVVDLPWVRQQLATFRAKHDVLRLMSWHQAWTLTRGELPPAQASAVKVFGSELLVEGYRLLMEVLGEAGLLREGSPGAVLRGRVERLYRSALILTFGGGTNEVQRDIIAMAGLGLPHYKS